MVKSVLFVCTGNTCRSVMAEHLLRHYAAEAGLAIKVASAGLGAFAGSPAAANTVAVLEEKGISAKRHKARAVDAGLLAEFDLILAMTKAQQDRLRAINPAVSDKIFLLKEFPERMQGPREELTGSNEKDYEVSDPFGQSKEIYRQTRQEISRVLKAIINAWRREGEQA
ncbi:MAG TPA: low molecular weight protein arginine phosphatase [Firmicutes bacterium]|nr:low molecular weight protein arginine phosphatase [Bacillota bacterium]